MANLDKLRKAIRKLRNTKETLEEFSIPSDKALFDLSKKLTDLEAEYRQMRDTPVEHACVVCKRVKLFHKKVQSWLCSECAEWDGNEVLIIHV